MYDAMCPWARDDDFFACVVAESGAAVRVLDLGCGTGRLALGLTAAGHTVTGIDPARASLDAARAKPGAERVTWIEGTSPNASAGAFDVAVMTSHVAQFFLTDDEWMTTLHDLRRALVDGGRLSFDTRDPAARAWERWPIDWNRGVNLADGRVVRLAVEVTNVDGDVVSHDICYEFPEGDVLVSSATLRFRSEPALRTCLDNAGFAVEHIFGGWDRDAIGHADGEFLVVAQAV
ncbi:MAG: class I SAM-dependent methyltransferase [Acidimicrobiia bacterium]